VEHLRRQGVGADLVRRCMEEASQLAIEKLFVLTYRREFFGRFGFNEVEKTRLPQKIWTDCVKCPKFPLCDEVAMITRLS
jgi:amino-acid N-acetyltransferase